MSEGTLLRREAATAFSTRQVKLVRQDHGYDLIPFGEPISFKEMAAIRSSGGIAATFPENGELVLANVGVSVLLTMQVNDCQYLVLVEQNRGGDGMILKPVSGYVETPELDNPFDTVLREITEEVLLKQGVGYFPFQYDEQAVGSPYGLPLQSTAINLQPSDWLAGMHGSQVSINSQRLPLPVHLYVHCPTASVQLVYSLSVTLDAWPEQGFFVEDEPEDGFLVSRLKPDRRLVLARLQDGIPSGCFQLINGKLVPFNKAGYRLSEFFAPRENSMFVAHRHGELLGE